MLLDILELFVKVNRYKTFNEAATQLDIPLATLQRRIKKLEENLSIALFYREKGKLRLTEPGKTLYSQCISHIENLQGIVCDFKHNTDDNGNLIKVVAPNSLASCCFMNETLQEFSLQHANININLELQDESLSLTESEFDLAIKIGPLENSQNICKSIAKVNFILAAAPSLLAQYPTPTTIVDLADLPHITYSTMTSWQFTHSVHGHIAFSPHSNFISNDLKMCALATSYGRGIYYGPQFAINKLLEQGRVVKILEDYQPVTRDVSLLWPDKLIPFRTRLLIDYLSDKLTSIRV